MKKIALLALSVIASAAMAGVSSDFPEIKITGKSEQTVRLNNASATNSAGTQAEAQQNLASNTGDVDIKGKSTQTVIGRGVSAISNGASGVDAYASQNLSSNVGEVTIGHGGKSTQLTVLTGAIVSNNAGGNDAKAVQNVASNNACFVCQPGDRNNGGYPPKKP